MRDIVWLLEALSVKEEEEGENLLVPCLNLQILAELLKLLDFEVIKVFIDS